MDNPVDHFVDLGLVNYVRHPSNPNYVIYRFADKNRANSFETVLLEQRIWFEKTSEKGRLRLFYLFAVHKSDFDKVQKINFSVEARHKRPFIPNAGIRFLLLGLSATLMTLAIIGYCKQQGKLRSFGEKHTLEQSQPVKNKMP